MARSIIAAGFVMATALLSAAPASAHHSFAMFAKDTQSDLTGTVQAFEWTNPHVFIQLMVRGADGKMTEWSLECLSINRLARMGWNRNALHQGDKVTITLNPLKAGGPGGSVVRVKLADGTILKGVGED